MTKKDLIVPDLGDFVLYRLSGHDADAINRRRQDWVDYNTPNTSRTGLQTHFGNPAVAGQVYPALVVRSWGNFTFCAVNLQVFLDGNDVFWATSRTRGNDGGQWSARS